MNKIPTAEELLKDIVSCLKMEWEDLENDPDLIPYLIEEINNRTKLHVQDALKEAAEKAQWKQESEETSFGADKSRYDFVDTDYAGDPCTGYIISIDKDSILNAYPATNIK